MHLIRIIAALARQGCTGAQSEPVLAHPRPIALLANTLEANGGTIRSTIACLERSFAVERAVLVGAVLIFSF